MPLPLFFLVAAAAATLAVVVLAILHYDKVIAWFTSRNAIKEADKDNLAVTIKTKLDNGNYKVVQGIFNTRSEKFVDGQVIHAQKIDQRLDDLHGDEELVVYD